MSGNSTITYFVASSYKCSLFRSENDKTTDNHHPNLRQAFFNQVDSLFNGNEADQKKAHELLEVKYFDVG